MASELDQTITTIAASLGDVLPSGFRRRGRKWIRITDGVRQEVHLRRLRFSYGLDVVMFRLAFACGPDGAEMIGGDWFTEHADWKFRSDVDDRRIAEIVAEVHEDLGALVEFFERTATPTGYLSWVRERFERSPIRVLHAYTAFGMRREALALVDSPELVPHMDARELNLSYALAVLEACERFGERPSDRWIEFAFGALKAFRGRPSKKLKASYERARGLLDSIAEP